jgi:phage terminase large subunit
MEYLDGGGTRAYLVAHRRFGKDLVALHQTCIAGHEARGAYWHCLPSYEQARKSLWLGFTRSGERIMELVFPAPLRKRPKEWLPNGDMLVELKNGSIVQLIGSDMIDSLVGAGPRHVTFSEFALSRPTVWPLIRPMLEENGGSASFLTTPRGRNFAHELWKLAQVNPAWHTESVDIFSSGAFPDPQAEIAKAKLEGMPDALIEQEYLCSWDAANVGSIWGDLLSLLEKQGAMGPFEHERDRCFASFDLGVRDSTCIWIWRVQDGEVQFVDAFEGHGKPLSHYADWLEMRAEQMRYEYVRLYLPHDARARTLQTGVSTVELLNERFRGKVAVTPSLSLADGIQAARWLLQGKVRFHERCAAGVEALKSYAYEYDEDARTFSSKPDHSWASHYADAFRYAAIVVRTTELREKARAASLAPKAEPDIPPLSRAITWDKFWEHEQSLGGTLARRRRI